MAIRLGRRLALAVVEDAVDHAVIILHGHLRIFQRVIREKTRNLLKSNPINVVAGYHAVLFEGNDVADAYLWHRQSPSRRAGCPQ